MLICSKSRQRPLINSNEKLDVRVMDETLQIVEKTKYLGVQIDQNLKLKEYIKCSRINIFEIHRVSEIH